MKVNAHPNTLLTCQGYVRATLRVSKHWLIGNIDVIDTRNFKCHSQWISSLVPQCPISHWRECDPSRIETMMRMVDIMVGFRCMMILNSWCSSKGETKVNLEFNITI